MSRVAFNPSFPEDFKGHLVIFVEMHLTHFFFRILKVICTSPSLHGLRPLASGLRPLALA